MPCNPSAPPVMPTSWLANSSSSSDTAMPSISSVKPLVRRMMAPAAAPSTPATTPEIARADSGSPQPYLASNPAV